VIPALVLTAGLATRLRPLSLVRAKAAIPVAGRSLASRILERLKAGGVSDVVLNLHHLPHTITADIGDGRHLGMRVRYSWEGTVLGSAGGPKRAVPLIDRETFLVVNGDTLATVDLAALGRHHRDSGALVTMAVMPNREPHKYGGIAVAPDGAMTGVVRRGETTPSRHFVGIQIVEAAAFEGVPADVPWESVATLYPALLAAHPGSVRTCTVASDFHDIGTPRDYLDTCLRLGGAARAAGAAVTESILWDGVSVGAGASLTKCVVTDGVAIPAGSTWSNQIVRLAAAAPLTAAETRVGELAVSSL
jgi:NDP-sugar pyrophosphorylase family protein